MKTDEVTAKSSTSGASTGSALGKFLSDRAKEESSKFLNYFKFDAGLYVLYDFAPMFGFNNVNLNGLVEVNFSSDIIGNNLGDHYKVGTLHQFKNMIKVGVECSYSLFNSENFSLKGSVNISLKPLGFATLKGEEIVLTGTQDDNVEALKKHKKANFGEFC